MPNTAGLHAASETEQAGYAASDWTGDCAANGSITMELATDYICYITNDDIAPTLTLVKTVTNDDGGLLTQDDFPSFVDAIAQAWDAKVPNTAGLHAASETEQAGYAASDWTGDCATDGSITMELDNDYICYITNDDIAPTLTLVKIVLNGSNPGGTLTQVDFPSFVDDNPQAWDVTVDHLAGGHIASETPQAGYIAGDWGGDCNADGTITLELDNDYICEITNTAMGMTDMYKLTDGIETTGTWNFSLFGPGIGTVLDSTLPALLDFGGVKLIPGETYTMCELAIPHGVQAVWTLDANRNGIIDIPPDSELPFVGAMTGNLWEVYNPDASLDPPEDNGDRCVDFQAGIGETVSFIIDNRVPDGDARTPGYWSNWSSCTNGNQFDKAAGEYDDGLDPRHITLDEILPQWIGDLYLDGDTTGGTVYDGDNNADCEEAVWVLQSRDQLGNHKKRSSDAAYKLARSYLAYKANRSPVQTSYYCEAAEDAAGKAQILLDGVNYVGEGDYLSPKGKVSESMQLLIQEALDLNGILDAYNNNDPLLDCSL